MTKGLTICFWLGPPWFNYWFSFTLAYSRIGHEYSSLFIIVINLIFMFSLLCLCHFILVFFSPFSIAITLLGEERANLSAFRMFVQFVLVWICRFPLPLGVWEGLRFVIVALPGLFSYLFLYGVNPSLAGNKMNQACKRGYLYLRSHYPLNFTSIFMKFSRIICRS